MTLSRKEAQAYSWLLDQIMAGTPVDIVTLEISGDEPDIRHAIKLKIENLACMHGSEGERTSSIKPITPEEAFLKVVPDEVLIVVNELLAQRWNGRSCMITQEEVIIAVLKLMVDQGITREEIFNRGWLDIEPHYRAAGWIVRYDKPGFNDSYKAFWAFSR